MTCLEAMVLGIIQGLTEFLPVSSSGHLQIGTVLLGVQTKDNLLFSIVVHGATTLSTILVFRKDIALIITDLLKFQWNPSLQFTLKILISAVPVGVAGLLFEDQIAALFTGNVLLVGGMLVITGLLLLFTYLKGETRGKLSYPKALIVGLAQAIAIMPGISRSGATISTALLLGVNREQAASFSFLMVLVPIIGAMLLKLRDLIETPALASDISPLVMLAGFCTAFISGLLACRWMIAIVKKGKLMYFALYCLAVGAAAIASSLFIAK